jgi:peptide/nickel transport system ATP-binding protein
VADEPVSMIDASLPALVLSNLRTLNSELGIPIIYITHDLTTAYHIADVILVLYRGSVVEAGTAETVIEDPQHPYTRLLVDSIPWPDLATRWGASQPILKEDRVAASRPAGCAFAGRCPAVMPTCRAEVPALFATDDKSAVRCLLHASPTAIDEDRLSDLLGLTSARAQPEGTRR